MWQGFARIRKNWDVLLIGVLAVAVVGLLYYEMRPRPVFTLTYEQMPPVAEKLPDPPVVTTPTHLVETVPLVESHPKGEKSSSHTRKSAMNRLLMVNINRAGVGELEQLPGIGPKMARRILDYRTKHGAFTKVEELLNVDGIGNKSLAKLLPHITVRPST